MLAKLLDHLINWINTAHDNGEISACCTATAQARMLWAVVEHGIQMQRLLPEVTLPELVTCWYNTVATETP